MKNTDDVLFYLPPYFYPETRPRNVIQTPFQSHFTSSNDPFNVAFSFGVGGKEINVENFVREYVQKEYPRLMHMQSELMTGNVLNMTADDYVYSSGSILRRNFLLLPNDNGLFQPNYQILQTQATGSLTASFGKESNAYDYSLISLEELIPYSSLYPTLVPTQGEIMDAIMGASPENPGVRPGPVLTIAQRMRDTSSNEIVIYNISNLYYGNRINPESFEIIENSLTGSCGKLKFTIKDNGRGGLYRADSLTKHATWNNVGNIFYDEGLAIIKTPHLPYLSKDKTEVKLRGEHNVHSLVLNVPVYRGYFNSSSNLSYKSLPPSENLNDKHLNAIQFTSVNIHDENFNIIMRANFSQPIVKTEEDEFVVRIKEDF